MKRIGKSKNPLFHQLPTIVENLRKKLNVSCYIKVEVADYNHNFPNLKQEYSFSFVPGLDESNCSLEEFKSWPELLDRYFELMRG